MLTEQIKNDLARSWNEVEEAGQSIQCVLEEFVGADRELREILTAIANRLTKAQCYLSSYVTCEDLERINME